MWPCASNADRVSLVLMCGKSAPARFRVQAWSLRRARSPASPARATTPHCPRTPPNRWCRTRARQRSRQGGHGLPRSCSRCPNRAGRASSRRTVPARSAAAAPAHIRMPMPPMKLLSRTMAKLRRCQPAALRSQSSRKRAGVFTRVGPGRRAEPTDDLPVGEERKNRLRVVGVQRPQQQSSRADGLGHWLHRLRFRRAGRARPASAAAAPPRRRAAAMSAWRAAGRASR